MKAIINSSVLVLILVVAFLCAPKRVETRTMLLTEYADSVVEDPLSDIGSLTDVKETFGGCDISQGWYNDSAWYLNQDWYNKAKIATAAGARPSCVRKKLPSGSVDEYCYRCSCSSNYYSMSSCPKNAVCSLCKEGPSRFYYHFENCDTEYVKETENGETKCYHDCAGNKYLLTQKPSNASYTECTSGRSGDTAVYYKITGCNTGYKLKNADTASAECVAKECSDYGYADNTSSYGSQYVCEKVTAKLGSNSSGTCYKCTCVGWDDMEASSCPLGLVEGSNGCSGTRQVCATCQDRGYTTEKCAAGYHSVGSCAIDESWHTPCEAMTCEDYSNDSYKYFSSSNSDRDYFRYSGKEYLQTGNTKQYCYRYTCDTGGDPTCVGGQTSVCNKGYRTVRVCTACNSIAYNICEAKTCAYYGFLDEEASGQYCLSQNKQQGDDNKACYLCTCAEGGSESCTGYTNLYCPSGYTKKSCKNCAGSTLYTCGSKATKCEDYEGYYTTTQNGMSCTSSYQYLFKDGASSTTYTKCYNCICKEGGSETCTGQSSVSCGTGYKKTSCKNCAGSTLYTCEAKTCEDYGYYDTEQEGKSCSSRTQTLGKTSAQCFYCTSYCKTGYIATGDKDSLGNPVCRAKTCEDYDGYSTTPRDGIGCSSSSLPLGETSAQCYLCSCGTNTGYTATRYTDSSGKTRYTCSKATKCEDYEGYYTAELNIMSCTSSYQYLFTTSSSSATSTKCYKCTCATGGSLTCTGGQTHSCGAGYVEDESKRCTGCDGQTHYTCKAITSCADYGMLDEEESGKVCVSERKTLGGSSATCYLCTCAPSGKNTCTGETSIPSNNGWVVLGQCTNCSAETVYRLRPKTCHDWQLLSAKVDGQVCTGSSKYLGNTYTTCYNCTCATGGSATCTGQTSSSCGNGYVLDESKTCTACDGQPRYTCRAKTCEDYGYYTTEQTGMNCTSSYQNLGGTSTKCYNCTCATGGSTTCTGESSVYCSTGYKKTSCTNCSGTTLYTCEAKTCEDYGYYTTEQTGMNCLYTLQSLGAESKTCYNCTCPSGGSTTCTGESYVYCSTGYTKTSCKNCAGTTLYTCKAKTCEDYGYYTTEQTGMNCTFSYQNLGGTSTKCYNCTCLLGGSATCTGELSVSCSSGYKETSCKNCAGITLYTCEAKTCEDYGYYTTMPTGKACSYGYQYLGDRYMSCYKCS